MSVAVPPEALAMVPVENIHPGPLQLRTTVHAELDTTDRQPSSLTAGAVRTVAGFAVRASTARAAQLFATRNLFGHHVHLLFGGQPAGAVSDVPAVRSRRPEQPHVEGPQLPFESCQLRDPLPRLGQLDQMAQTIALGSDICTSSSPSAAPSSCTTSSK